MVYFNASFQEIEQLRTVVNDILVDGVKEKLEKTQKQMKTNYAVGYHELRNICSHVAEQALEKTGLYHCFVYNNDALKSDDKLYKQYAKSNFCHMLIDDSFWEDKLRIRGEY